MLILCYSFYCLFLLGLILVIWRVEKLFATIRGAFLVGLAATVAVLVNSATQVYGMQNLLPGMYLYVKLPLVAICYGLAAFAIAWSVFTLIFSILGTKYYHLQQETSQLQALIAVIVVVGAGYSLVALLENQYRVRQIRVTANSQLLSEFYQNAMKHTNYGELTAVATNPNTTPEMIHALLQKIPAYSLPSAQQLLLAITRNNNVPSGYLRRLITQRHNAGIAAIAGKPTLSPEMVLFLMENSDGAQKLKLLNGENINRDLLEQLANDRDPMVAAKAKQKIKRLQTVH